MARPLVVLVTVLVVLSAVPAGTIGQEASPAASPSASPVATEAPADLAAMALPAEELPAGYLLQFEQLTQGEAFAQQMVSVSGGGITADELLATGVRRSYDSMYMTAEGGNIRSYLIDYPSPDAAEEGFALLEDEERMAAGPNVRDEPLEDIGDAPTELTVGGEQGFYIADATFRVGHLVAGVSVSSPGSAPQDQLARDLAAVLAERIAQVQAGNAPAGIDIDLPPTLLPLATLGPDQVLADGQGYVSATEAFRVGDPALADEMPEVPAELTDGYTSGYERNLTIGTRPEGAQPGLGDIYAGSVNFGVYTLTSPEARDAFLTLAGDLYPADAPFEEAAAPEVPGADQVAAFRMTPPAAPHALRLVFVVDDRVGKVEVWDLPTADDVEAAALELATQQVSCLRAGGPCQASTVPAPIEEALAVAAERAALPIPESEQISGEECQVEPRPIEEIEALVATPIATPTEVTAEATPGVPAGEPVDPEIASEIEAAVRQWIACANTNDPFRSWALFTDAALLRLGLPPAEEVSRLATPQPAPPPEFGLGLVSIDAPQRLPDDRVSVVVTVVPGESAPPERLLFIFVAQDGQWLIDDLQFLPPEEVGPATPAVASPAA